MLGQDNLLLLLADDCRPPLTMLLKLLKLFVSDVVAVVAVWIVFDDDGGDGAFFDFHDDGGDDAAAHDPLPTLLKDCENPMCGFETS